MNIIFLGAPGAGKGTQASEVASEMGVAHIATGDLFRAAQNQGTELAKEVRSYMEKGLLVPDDVTIRMVLDRIVQPDSSGGVIFDGFPRNLKQAEALDKALDEQDKAINKVIYIKVPASWACTRPSLVHPSCRAWPCATTPSPPISKSSAAPS